jgi:GlpG protein
LIELPDLWTHQREANVGFVRSEVDAMREIAALADESQAKSLADYLLTLEIPTKVMLASGRWSVWAQREEQVERAKQESAAFLANPEDPKYRDAGRIAETARKEIARGEREHRKSSIDLRGRLNVITARRCPVTFGLIAASIGVAILTGLGANREACAPFLFSKFVPVPLPEAAVESEDRGDPLQGRVRSAGLDAIKSGQVWRLVTPIFLHFGFLHIAFNMLWLYRLGGLIELRKSSLKTAGLVLLSAVASNYGEYLWESYRYGPVHAAAFGGMSGVVYALFGYVWMKSEYEPDSDMKLPSNTIGSMLIWLIICMYGFLGNIANAAHVVGLFAGMIVGLIPHLLADLRGR